MAETAPVMMGFISVLDDGDKNVKSQCRCFGMEASAMRNDQSQALRHKVTDNFVV